MRRTLRTRVPLLTARGHGDLERLSAHHRRLRTSRPTPRQDHDDPIIDSLRRGVPAILAERAQLGRTLHRRRADILAFFDHHASNGPTEAINGRLEALRRNALGFRNLTHYRWRSLLHSGALHSLVNAL